MKILDTNNIQMKCHILLFFIIMSFDESKDTLNPPSHLVPVKRETVEYLKQTWVYG